MSATSLQVRTGIAGNLSSILGIQASPYLLSDPSPPCALVMRGKIDYDQAMGGGVHLWEFVVRMFVANVSDKGAAAKLDAYLSADGSSSVKAAIESDRTLGGAVSDLHVTEATGETVYTRDSGGQLLGSEFTVEVWL